MFPGELFPWGTKEVTPLGMSQGTPKASQFDLYTSQIRFFCFFLFLKVNLECLVELMDLV